MTDTIIAIKDDYGTAASAESIINNICKPLVAAANDIKLTQIIVFVNSNIEDCAWRTYIDTLPIRESVAVVIRTLNEKLRPLSFAMFHNSVVDSMMQNFDFPVGNNVNLHIISGSLVINANTTEATRGYKTLVGSFINDMIDLTRLLKRPIWFSTASDGANYAFGHYFTSADIINIDGKVKHFDAPKCIMWSGNSNIDWIYVNTAMTTPISIRLNAEYDYDFLSIKEMIAKTTAMPGYFVNMFPTIPSEVGTFYRANAFNRDNTPYDFTDNKYKENIELYSKNVQDFAATAGNKSVNDVVNYMRSVLPIAKK